MYPGIPKTKLVISSPTPSDFQLDVVALPCIGGFSCFSCCAALGLAQAMPAANLDLVCDCQGVYTPLV